MTRKRKPNNQQPPARPFIIALVLVAIAAGVALGLALNRPVGPQPALLETPTVPTATDTPVPTTPQPIATFGIEPPLPGATVDPSATLRLRFDVRDAETGQPVRATIFVSEQMVVQGVSLYEIGIEETKQGSKWAPIRVEAEGYEVMG